MSFTVNPKWWFFIVATVPLTLLVFAVWYWWVRVGKKKDNRVDEETQ